MINKKIIKNIYDTIKNANKIGLTIHTDPDGDALGSIIAFMLLCKQLSKKVIPYAPPFNKDSWSIFGNIDNLSKHFDPDDNIDLMIVLDCGSQSRIFNYAAIRKNVKTIINIDHHADNNQFGDINWTDHFSSVGEMIYLFLSEFDFDLNEEIAKTLYVAIYMDTGGFRFSNTSVGTLRIVEKLIEAGVDSNKIISELRNNKTKLDLIGLGNTLLRVKTTENNKIIWTVKKQEECKLNIDPLSSLREVKGAEIAIVFEEKEPNIFKISFRAVNNANVQKIATHFGGGGHLAAAGTTIKGTEQEIVKKVINYAEKTLN